jgi:primosomal protein N'
MTKKLEETLNLASFDLDIDENDDVVDAPVVIDHAMKVDERLDIALSNIENVAADDKEIDDIADKAIETFEDMIALSENVQDQYVARLYEVANSMLNTALNARNAKMQRKLKTLELQLKKAKLDQDANNAPPKTPADNTGGPKDRNELLRLHRNKTVEETGKNDK